MFALRSARSASPALRTISALRFRVPTGGMALWADVDPAVDVDAWSVRAAAHGVLFQPGSAFALSGKPFHAARFGFAMCTEAELTEAARRLRLSHALVGQY